MYMHQHTHTHNHHSYADVFYVKFILTNLLQACIEETFVLSYLVGVSFKILQSAKSKSMLSASFSLLWIQYSIEAINYNHLNNGPVSNLHPKQPLYVLFNSKCWSNLNNFASRHLVLASHKSCYFHVNPATWLVARWTATTSRLGSGAHTDYQIITGTLSSEDEVAEGWCCSFVAT
jgi:hypothetical protein